MFRTLFGPGLGLGLGLVGPGLGLGLGLGSRSRSRSRSRQFRSRSWSRSRSCVWSRLTSLPLLSLGQIRRKARYQRQGFLALGLLLESRFSTYMRASVSTNCSLSGARQARALSFFCRLRPYRPACISNVEYRCQTIIANFPRRYRHKQKLIMVIRRYPHPVAYLGGPIMPWPPWQMADFRRA
jgi:hypothetical protein